MYESEYAYAYLSMMRNQLNGWEIQWIDEEVKFDLINQNGSVKVSL